MTEDGDHPGFEAPGPSLPRGFDVVLQEKHLPPELDPPDPEDPQDFWKDVGEAQGDAYLFGLILDRHLAQAQLGFPSITGEVEDQDAESGKDARDRLEQVYQTRVQAVTDYKREVGITDSPSPTEAT